MSRKEIVFLVCRSLAVLFLSSTIVEATYLPEKIFPLIRHMNGSNVGASNEYFKNAYLIDFIFFSLRVSLFALATSLFWNVGPKIEGLFSPQVGSQPNKSL